MLSRVEGLKSTRPSQKSVKQGKAKDESRFHQKTTMNHINHKEYEDNKFLTLNSVDATLTIKACKREKKYQKMDIS